MFAMMDWIGWWWDPNTYIAIAIEEEQALKDGKGACKSADLTTTSTSTTTTILPSQFPFPQHAYFVMAMENLQANSQIPPRQYIICVPIAV